MIQIKDNIFTQVFTTNDYSKFKVLHGNRLVNDSNLNRLIRSFKEKYLLSPILVNEKYEIIDGQHRFNAAKSLNLPIYYIMIYGYTINEVQILNTNSRNWTKIDYLNAYCDMGNSEYLKLRQFMIDFPEFGIASSEAIVTNTTRGINSRNLIHQKQGRMKNFEEGKLKIHNIDEAYLIANKIKAFAPYYNGFNRSGFVATMITIFKNENYNNDLMLRKLQMQPTALKHCADVSQYKILIEDIYNYKNQNKINLRF
jgi:hypothetical protein